MASPVRMLTNAPIPGQSLTQDPDTKIMAERPPVHSEMNETVGHIFDDLTSEEKLGEVTKLLLGKKMYIDTLTSAYIEQGLVKGDWNADIAHLLIEPILFIFMWIGSQVGAPIKFKDKSFYDSSGMDVLSGAREENLDEAVASLLAPEEEV